MLKEHKTIQEWVKRKYSDTFIVRRVSCDFTDPQNPGDSTPGESAKTASSSCGAEKDLYLQSEQYFGRCW